MGDDRLQRAPNNTGAKIFKDSVHGVMKFPKLVVKFIATKEFQRLSNIKQLSTLYMVFPAAAHNRFEHSLGVCHLAGELLTHLQQNSPGVWNWIFDSESEGERVKLAVQLAGLLHDLGHGPFSHTWEKFVHSRGEKWDHEDSAGDLLDLIIWGDSNKTQLTEVGEAFEKEFLDVDKYLQLIKHLIEGKRGLDLVNKDYGLEKKRAFIYQVVANKVNDVDVDKFDYFLRDAQHLNMGIAFDYQRLMNHCRIEIKNDTTSFIAFRDCEAYNLQALFRTRADIHIRACQHRVHVCLEKMLIDAMTLADKSDFKVG
ncbi:deoxynucleoside triphosphate triphosphohydrolase SAMHD1-like isoform X2 [Frankliniella occidentalis]|uniref:Deoxynucleoside triphosphate triphosphohydrolase SAMHD1-like isoform X2 n=1 Tax=Frankliniella occidentalis TaxID=133901 RepID=A0A9C6X2P1_FRAOC|nr:deoxynucleoside triphosphate triphosphohydrolase SAMHD1-like isoform X2 [Frankliniella occidentalis]